MKDKLYRKLFESSRHGDTDDALNILNQSAIAEQIINILGSDGQILCIAFESNNSELMKALIEYYEKNILGRIEDEAESKKMNTKFIAMIDKIVEDEEVSDEMKEALGKYLDEDLIKASGETFSYDCETDTHNAYDDSGDHSDVSLATIGSSHDE
jgi:uncharacterized membrane-anchored protein YjiN (DUF445 family)